MIRPICLKDRDFYLKSAQAFYESDAVLTNIPKENIEKTFSLLIGTSPCAGCFIFEKEGKRCGYALLAKTWSQEAGGEVVWIEEIYVLPEFRSKGLGKEFFSFLDKHYNGRAKRFRLEVEDDNENAIRLYQNLGFSFFPYKQMKKEF